MERRKTGLIKVNKNRTYFWSDLTYRQLVPLPLPSTCKVYVTLIVNRSSLKSKDGLEELGQGGEGKQQVLPSTVCQVYQV